MLKENLARRLRGERIAPYEISLTKKDGSKVPVLVRAAKILYNQRPAIEFVFDDISDRKRMEDKVLALHKHASQLSTAESIDTIINHTLDALEFTLGFDHIHFLLVENNCLQIKGSRGKPVAFSAQPLDGRGLTVKAANTKTTLRIRDTRKETAFVDPEGYDWTGPPTVLSELIVPVLVDAQAAAVLCVDSVRQDAFTGEDQILVETLATHVASCLTRLKHEEALRLSEARFKKYFDLGLIGMAIETPAGNWIAVNDRLCEMLGYDRTELVKKDWAELTHPDDLARDNELFDSLIRGDIDQYSIEKRFIRKDGQVVDCIIAVNCTPGKMGEWIKYLGSLLTLLNVSDWMKSFRSQLNSWNASSKMRMFGWT